MEVLLGSIINTTGVFTVADVEEIDTRWMTPSQAGGGRWIMDITGPHAQQLGGRLGLPRETLCDGTVRVLLSDQQAGLAETKECIFTQGWVNTDNAQVFASAASRVKLHDAARKDGAGLVADRLASIAFEKGKPVQVYGVTDANGKIVELRLRVS